MNDEFHLKHQKTLVWIQTSPKCHSSSEQHLRCNQDSFNIQCMPLHSLTELRMIKAHTCSIYHVQGLVLSILFMLIHLILPARGICSEKGIARQICYCANIIECTYTNPDGVGYYTLRLCIILWNHHSVCGLSLTEMPLCRAWLSCKKMPMESW